MKGVRYGEGIKVIPVLAPKNIAATLTETAYVDLDLVNWVTFVANIGALSSAGGTCDDVTITVVTSSLASTASTTGISFQYRLSSAIGTDAWGAITAGTSDGVAVDYSADNASMIIDLDPVVAHAKSSVKRFVAVTFTPASTSSFVSCNALVEPRYPGNSIPSSS